MRSLLWISCADEGWRAVRPWTVHLTSCSSVLTKKQNVGAAISPVTLHKEVRGYERHPAKRSDKGHHQTSESFRTMHTVWINAVHRRGIVLAWPGLGSTQRQ